MSSAKRRGTSSSTTVRRRSGCSAPRRPRCPASWWIASGALWALEFSRSTSFASWPAISSATKKAAPRRGRSTRPSASCPASAPYDFSMPGWIDFTKENGMATVTTDHYRAYTPRPFTRAERDSVTILFGGLHWRIERILQAVLESSGYRARILPVATKEDLLTGRETADIGQCCPTSFTTGNLVNFLKKESKQVGVE